MALADLEQVQVAPQAIFIKSEAGIFSPRHQAPRGTLFRGINGCPAGILSIRIRDGGGRLLSRPAIREDAAPPPLGRLSNGLPFVLASNLNRGCDDETTHGAVGTRNSARISRPASPPIGFALGTEFRTLACDGFSAMHRSSRYEHADTTARCRMTRCCRVATVGGRRILS
jgi:hypothetical protein